MLLKLTGACVLFCGCLCIGIFKAGELSGRVNTIMGLEEAVLIFEGEVEYRLATIYDAFSVAAARDISEIFKNSLEGIERQGAATALHTAVINSGIEKDEMNTMLSFAAGLASPDKEGQLQNARLCRERLKSILKSASEKKEQLGKLYCVSGGLFGAAVSILFL